MPGWVTEGYNEYARRLPREHTPRLVELPLANRSKAVNVDRIKAREGTQIMAALSKGAHVVALDVGGKSLSTRALADKLQAWQMRGTDIDLVIGGPDGLSSECKDRADELLSLSALTLPHPLVRLVIIEQIYRAWTIVRNHPYHK